MKRGCHLQPLFLFRINLNLLPILSIFALTMIASTKPKIYFISGLGADERAFHFLELSFCQPIFIKWLTPDKNETLRDYAMRLMAAMPEENPNIVGLSFGGMLASEIALAKPLAKVVIISSNKTSNEFPSYFLIGRYLPLYKMIPTDIMKYTKGIFGSFFGAEGSEQKKIQQIIAQETDIKFTKWAISSILKWQNKTSPTNITHIHGTSDKLLSYSFVKADYTIKGGKHLMVMDKADEISVLLKMLFI